MFHPRRLRSCLLYTSEFDEADFRKLGVRVVPGAIVRAGSHIGKDVVLMPSFVNIGAHVGEGTMVAVSYTHLDVYKRQPRCCPMAGPW